MDFSEFARVSRFDHQEDILQHLERAYVADAEKRGAMAEGLLQMAKPFIDFARDYLAKNRPVQLFHADANYGFQLANGVSCLLAPAANSMLPGQMQASQAVPISGVVEDNRGPGMQPSQAIPINVSKG